MTRPTVFSDLDFDSALKEATAHGKLLLVDATAGWCGPCQIMDRTTWVAPAVVDAVGRRAVAIQFDVDEQAELKQQLRIHAMPTVVAFRRGAEVDRVVGLQRPEQIIAWIEALERGETSLQMIRTQTIASPTDVQVRMALARKLVEAGQLDEATSEYVWLWQHMLEHEPAMVGVRHSFLVRDLQELVSRHGPARDAFARLRDAVAPPTAAEPTREALMDWFSLNEVLGERHASLGWFDSVRGRLDPDGPLATLLEHRVVPMLVEAGRWPDVASLYPKPIATLSRHADMRARMSGAQVPAAIAEQAREHAARSLRETAGLLVRALNAAGRRDEACAVAEEARRLDPSAAMEAALAAQVETE